MSDIKLFRVMQCPRCAMGMAGRASSRWRSRHQFSSWLHPQSNCWRMYGVLGQISQPVSAKTLVATTKAARLGLRVFSFGV
jgi:hypothetical protein